MSRILAIAAISVAVLFGAVAAHAGIRNGDLPPPASSQDASIAAVVSFA